MPDPALETLARDQKRWSLTADRLKKSIGRSRVAVMMLAVLGAVLETLGAQIHGSHPDSAVVIGYLGAAALALLGVIRQLRLGRERVQAWILARAASESFKKEMYLYRTVSGPYSGPQKSSTLIDRRDEILRKVQTVQKYVVEPNESQVKGPELLNVEGYREERIKGQITYFRDHAKAYAELQDRFGGAEFVLAIGAALLGAALTMTGKQPYGAWVAVITTIAGVAAAHVIGQRYEQLVVSYRATADRLQGIDVRYEAIGGPLDELVQQTEAVLFEQNQGWIAGADEMMKDGTIPPPPPSGPAGQVRTGL